MIIILETMLMDLLIKAIWADPSRCNFAILISAPEANNLILVIIYHTKSIILNHIFLFDNRINDLI